MKSIRCTIATFLALLSLPIASCRNDNQVSNAANETRDTPSGFQKHTAGESLYQLEGEWSDQNNTTVSLADLKGKVQVVAMVFTGCKYSCTQIVAEMRNMERQIPENNRGDVGFVLVSFDVDRDTPDKLNTFAHTMNMDDRWTLLHGDEQQVRELSALLGVKYAKQPNGDFAHSNVITVLDRNGAVATRLEGLNNDAKETIQVIRALVE